MRALLADRPKGEEMYTIRNDDTNETTEIASLDHPPDGWRKFSVIEYPPSPRTFIFENPVFREEADGSMTLLEGKTWEEAAHLAFQCYQSALKGQDRIRNQILRDLRDLDAMLP